MKSMSLLALAVVALAGWGVRQAAAHEDVVTGPHGVERITDPLIGQGRNTSQDRAYAWWAQYDDNLTNVLESPAGRRWITVGEAIPWAKRVWGVNILDETNDPEVARIRFAVGFGPVEREMALPLFLEALASAVRARQDCYLEQDETVAYSGGFHNYHKGTVHLRCARPLQPDYDHPSDPDKVAIHQLRVSLAPLPRLSSRFCAPVASLHERCMDCQARTAVVLARYLAQGGVFAANSAPCLAEMIQVCRNCPHCHAYWISRHTESHQPEVKPGVAENKAETPETK